ncbi:MAG TPA: MFS transporter [Stellaceae bacterium]|nr:MFS transporter [Stellaceae bacterium]
MATAATVDVSDIIDRPVISGFQFRTLLLCMAVLFMDGYDTQAIGYVAPALVATWHVGKSALTPVFVLGLVGLMIGGLLFGPLADRFGRKRFIAVSTTLFGIFSLTSAFAGSLDQLLVLRFLTGLGLGGAMPNAVALGVEYFPRRLRATAVTVVFVGFTIGAAVGGFIAAGLLPAFGWPSVFLVGGAVPLLMVPVLLLALPESVALLILKQRPGTEIIRYLSRIDPSLDLASETRFTSREENRRGVPVQHLFTEGRALGSTLLWIVFFLSLLVTFLLTSWLPIVFNSAGLALGHAVAATAMWQVGAMVGTLAIGRLMDRFNPYRALAAGFVVGALAVLALMAVSAAMPFALSLLLIFVVGCLQGTGGTQGANALAGWYYPTFIRSTGIGWALGIGRVGSIAGALLGGILLLLHWRPSSIFLVAAAAGICSAAAVAAMGRFGGARSA